MLRALELRSLQLAHKFSVRGASQRFERALSACEATQAARLQRLVARNAQSAYGHEHGFADIRSVRDWQNRIPMVDYEEIHPWVLRAARGEPNVLTSAPVRMFERTSGSAAASKLIPYTDDLRDDFGAATGPWLYDLYSSFLRLPGTTSYWSITPATRKPEKTEGGIPVGFDDDTEYFGRFERFALRHMLAVPPALARVQDMEAWAHFTVRALVAAADLGLVSVWHPSFFALLMRRIEARLDELLIALPDPRALQIRKRLERVPLGEALWPRLAIVSCWADGPAAGFAKALQSLVPHAVIQPKGLMATEGVVTFPLQRGSESIAVAAIASHFLEFLDLESPNKRPSLAHELKPGAHYAPIISTGGGFYRYRLGDALYCEGFYRDAPLLRFLGRIDQVSDLRGEKLSPRLVAAAVCHAEQAIGTALAFALLAPVQADPPYYCLYAEGADSHRLHAVCCALESKLRESHAYCYARDLGQLGPIRPVAVRDAAEKYIRTRSSAGQRFGAVKPAQLDERCDWQSVLGSPSSGEHRAKETECTDAA